MGLTYALVSTCVCLLSSWVPKKGSMLLLFETVALVFQNIVHGRDVRKPVNMVNANLTEVTIFPLQKCFYVLCCLRLVKNKIQTAVTNMTKQRMF